MRHCDCISRSAAARIGGCRRVAQPVYELPVNRAVSEGLPAEFFDDQVERFELSFEGLTRFDVAVARRSTVPITLDLEDVGRRGEDDEVAIYYRRLEALQHVAKHAGNDASVRSTPGEGATVEGRLALQVHDPAREGVANV